MDVQKRYFLFALLFQLALYLSTVIYIICSTSVFKKKAKNKNKFISFYVRCRRESELGGDSVQVAPPNCGKSADKTATKYKAGTFYVQSWLSSLKENYCNNFFFAILTFKLKTKMLQKLFICNSDFQVTKNCQNFLSAILTLKIKKDTLQLTTKKQNFLPGVDTI